MARTPAKILEPVLEQRIVRLEEKLAFLWKMIVFLEEHPGYKINDYLAERFGEVHALTEEQVVE